MKKKYVLLLGLIALAGSCLRLRECEDVYSHDFNSLEMDWFSYELSDTMYFLNVNTGDTNSLYCYNEEIIDTFQYWFDGGCEEGVFNDYYQQMRNEFQIDFPLFSNDKLSSMKMTTRTAGELYLLIDIKIHNLYRIKFDNSIEKLENYGMGEPFSLGTINIQGKDYENVFAIPISEDPEYLSIVCYDTIYYNKDGFLKFISSEYGYRLERLP